MLEHWPARAESRWRRWARRSAIRFRKPTSTSSRAPRTRTSRRRKAARRRRDARARGRGRQGGGRHRRRLRDPRPELRDARRRHGGWPGSWTSRRRSATTWTTAWSRGRRPASACRPSSATSGTEAVPRSPGPEPLAEVEVGVCNGGDPPTDGAVQGHVLGTYSTARCCPGTRSWPTSCSAGRSARARAAAERVRRARPRGAHRRGPRGLAPQAGAAERFR